MPDRKYPDRITPHTKNGQRALDLIHPTMPMDPNEKDLGMASAILSDKSTADAWLEEKEKMYRFNEAMRGFSRLQPYTEIRNGIEQGFFDSDFGFTYMDPKVHEYLLTLATRASAGFKDGGDVEDASAAALEFSQHFKALDGIAALFAASGASWVTSGSHKPLGL